MGQFFAYATVITVKENDHVAKRYSKHLSRGIA